MKESTKPQSKKPFLTICIILVIALAGAGIAAYLISTSSNAKSTKKTAFMVNVDQLSGWWAGDNSYAADATNEGYQGSLDDIATITRTIAQGTPEKPGTCFITYLYWNDISDEESTIKLKGRSETGDPNLTYKEVAAKESIMNTPEGDKAYTFYTSELVGSPNSTIARGVAFGYIPLEKGAIEIRGTCETAPQLSSLDSVFEAVSLKYQKN